MSDQESHEMGTSGRLAKKFSGCLLGCLLGDCLGERFEYQGRVVIKKVEQFFIQLKEGKINDLLRYTDDSAMMKVLAKSIIEKGSVDVSDLAQKFPEEYYSDLNRGYGKNVPTVFSQLQKQATGDVFQPARDQFNGGGSYGNGAAMRVAPVALFYHKDTNLMIEAALNSSQVTHAHRNGYNGAVLLCLAIQSALNEDPGTSVDPAAFSNELLEKMAQIEQKESSRDYCEKLTKMQRLLTQPQPPKINEVISQLGNNVSALKSVPTAIFSFLFAQKAIEEIPEDNQFERTVRYAISLGGDTDTIGCMAGGLAGAHLGVDALPPHLTKLCEDNELVAQLAEKLFNKMSSH